jgi:hypothetical protein
LFPLQYKAPPKTHEVFLGSPSFLPFQYKVTGFNVLSDHFLVSPSLCLFLVLLNVFSSLKDC